MKVFTIHKDTSLLLLFVVFLCLLVIGYTSFILSFRWERPGSRLVNKRKRTELISWEQLMASWDYSFKVNSVPEGAIKNPYPNEVRFLVNEVNACEKPPMVIALVVTAVKHSKNRHFIRHTWGHPAMTARTGIKPLFMVGQTDMITEQAIVEEASKYNDIIQANFIDSYQNLTYKSIAILAWTAAFCSRAPILLKIDDDVFPNPLALSEFLVKYLKENPQPTPIMGKLRCCDPVLRLGKWAVSEKDFPGKQYPSYVAGPSYMVPTAIIPALLQAVKRTKFLHLEDVYVTGLAAAVGGLQHYQISSLTNSRGDKMDKLWCSGAKIFQENIGLRDAARGWNALRRLENISVPEEYTLPPNTLP